MIHPDTSLKFLNPLIGSGIFATQFIPKGTLTYVKDSLEIDLSPNQYLLNNEVMRQIIDKYSYINEKGHYIISWDQAKHINHSCEPNTISTGYGFELAIRDIQPGEEITDDYGLFNLEQGFSCACGSPSCRKKILPEDLDMLQDYWDKKILPALINISRVPQPLMKFMDETSLREIEDYLNGSLPYKSVSHLRFRKNEKMHEL
ncbi:MAG TPA: SET domain-containing protein-lysine N-methyltransferase [Cytophagales bacterium]|nr:SET domain-containing protein-lysine N-methyltransferase [Cytophagales bacterium]